MLTKLLKKDFRATSRNYLPLMIGFIILSILCKVLLEFGLRSSRTNEFLRITLIIFLSLYVIYIVGYYIMTYVFMVSDFYKTMVSEQGYLTHTLPVKTSTLINSKLLVAVFWQFTTSVLIILSFMLLLTGHISDASIQQSFYEFESSIGLFWGTYIWFMLVSMVIGAFSGPLMFYASIAIGHLFGKHRIIGAIVSYLGIYTVMQVFCTFVMIAMGYSIYNSNSLSLIFKSYMWFAIIFSTVTSIIFYVITELVFRKQLNLE